MASNTSSANVPLAQRILAASVTVSNKAAIIVRDIMKRGELGIVEKGKNDLQTEADRKAQRCIVASLHRMFPKVTIHAEENLDPTDTIPDELIVTDMDAEVLKQTFPPTYQYHWLLNGKDEDISIWVDPLDGTAEYTQGLLDHVTVLIGIAVKGIPLAGVINQPYYNYKAGDDSKLGRCIWGVVGLGAFGFEKVNSAPEGSNIITTTRSHSNQAVTEAVEACLPTEIIRVGGAGHKVLLLIEGRAHAYVFASNGCKKWDTCAPEAILRASGGFLTDILGLPIDYGLTCKYPNGTGVLATVDHHSWYVAQIPSWIKDMFQKERIPGARVW